MQLVLFRLVPDKLSSPTEARDGIMVASKPIGRGMFVPAWIGFSEDSYLARPRLGRRTIWYTLPEKPDYIHKI